MRLIVVLIAGFLLASSNGFAKANFSIVGAGVYSTASGTPTPTGALNLAGGGLLVNFNSAGKAHLEIGAIYTTRVMTISGTARTFTSIEGIVGLRYDLTKALSLTGGLYGNYYLTRGLSTTGVDFGASAGIGVSIPVKKSIGILVDGRYHYALGQLTYSGGNFTPHEAQIFAGITIGKSK